MTQAEPKVATLRLDAKAWNHLTPQQQLLMLVHQSTTFMASEFFAAFEGLEIQVIDTNNILNCSIVLQVGQKPLKVISNAN